LNILRKYFEKIEFYKDLIKIKGTLHEDQYTYYIICRLILLGMRNVLDKSCIENHNTFCIHFPSKIATLCYKVERFCRDLQAKDDNMAHARCILDD